MTFIQTEIHAVPAKELSRAVAAELEKTDSDANLDYINKLIGGVAKKKDKMGADNDFENKLSQDETSGL
jgi:hypothetical protein